MRRKVLGTEELRPTNRRVEGFRTPYFAIAVTIMVLEIHVPDGLAFGNHPIALMHFTAAVATYALSFLVIVVLWGSHHYLIFTLPNADRPPMTAGAMSAFHPFLPLALARFEPHFT